MSLLFYVLAITASDDEAVVHAQIRMRQSLRLVT